MNHSEDELRAALRDYADGFALDRPDATVEDVQHRMTSARRRSVGTIAGLVAAAAVVTGVVVTRPSDPPPPAPRPAGTSPSHAAASSPFPEYTAGLRRLTVVDMPLVGDTPGTTVTIHGRQGAQLFAVARCPAATPTGDTPPGTRDASVQVTRSGVKTQAVCFGSQVLRQLGPEAATPLPPGGDEIVLHGTVRGTSAPRDAEARVAVYEEVPWPDYPFDRSRSMAKDSSDEDEGTPLRTITPRSASATNQRVTVTLDNPGNLALRLTATGPGQIKTVVNGQPLSPSRLLPETELPWQRKFAGYRGDWTSFWNRDGGQRWLWLQPRGRAARQFTPPAKGEPVTVTVQPRRFTTGTWKVRVYHVREPQTPTNAPEVTSTAPSTTAPTSGATSGTAVEETP